MQIRPAVSAPLPPGPGASAGGDSPSTGARDFAATLNSAAGAQRAAVAHPQAASSGPSPQHPDPGAAAGHRGERPPAAPRSGNASPSGGALPPGGERAPPASSADGSSASAVSGSSASGRGTSGKGAGGSGATQSASAGAGEPGATLAAVAGAPTSSPNPPVLVPDSAAGAAYALSGPSATSGPSGTSTAAPIATNGTSTAAPGATSDAGAATLARDAAVASGGPDVATGPSAASASPSASAALNANALKANALNANPAAAALASAPSLEAGAASSGAATSPLVGAMRLALTASADGVEQSVTALPPPQVVDASRIADAAAGTSTQAQPTSLAARFLGQFDSVLESPAPAPSRPSDTSAPTPTVNPVLIAGSPPAVTGASSLIALGAASPLAVVAAASGGGETEPQFSSDRRGHATLAGPDLGADGVLPAIGNSTAPSDSGAPTIKLDSTLDSPSFPAELAGRVAYLIGNNLGSAKLQVTPPQLGPIDLQISVQGNSAQIVMSTHSALTHAALESSAPALRELLGSQGFAQVSVDISQRSFQEQPTFTQPESTFAPRESVAAEPIAAVRSARSLLDAYA
ncbi:MAG TPA: flagellar hook-length control protein FliK [Steroidobacteraceae bacterium]|nr:flagellar hook-length control protein FliK [Steroidobacteraceae bacterium]